MKICNSFGFNLVDDTLSNSFQFLESDSLSVPDSILGDSSLILADTLFQTTVKHEPKIGGDAIDRIQNISFGNDWIVLVILFALFLLASVKFMFGKYLSKVTESIFSFHTANSHFLEKNINMIKGSAMVNIFFVVNISLFIVSILIFKSIPFVQEHGFKTFILVLIAVSLLYLGKAFVVRFLGYVFDKNNESREYVFTILLYNKNLSLFLFPIVLALPFVQFYAVKWLMYIGVVIALVFFVLRIVRGMQILLRKHVSIFYMILYLCALEIVPLLMLYKLFIK